MIYFDRIVDDVFVGTCPGSIIDVSRIKQAGITAILNLQTDLDFSVNGIDWPLLEREYHRLEIAAYRCPIIDFDDDELKSRLAATASTLNDMLQNQHCVYVHCTAGKQRSPSVVIGYLAWHREVALDRAVQLVMQARDCDPPVHVIESVDALQNRFQQPA